MISVVMRENTIVIKMRRTNIKIESFILILSKIACIVGVQKYASFFPDPPGEEID